MLSLLNGVSRGVNWWPLCSISFVLEEKSTLIFCFPLILLLGTGSFAVWTRFFPAIIELRKQIADGSPIHLRTLWLPSSIRRPMHVSMTTSWERGSPGCGGVHHKPCHHDIWGAAGVSTVQQVAHAYWC